MIGLQKRCQTLKKQAMAEQDLNYSSGRPVGQPAGRFLADYNVTAWPQLIIWDEDQMIWDDQLGSSVAIAFMYINVHIDNCNFANVSASPDILYSMIQDTHY